MALIDLALKRALIAHTGQLDKAGKPYILHPLRLMARFNDPIDQAVAVLHDVLEDSDTTAGDLRLDGIPEEVIEAVELLSRGKGVSYNDFIERIRPHPLARKVKMADLEDNLNILRLPNLGDGDQRRITKYYRAWHLLAMTENRELP
ncbi:GTP pyrophosphokinase [Pseudomonas sp. NPDC096950]|uniref:GTP pyrophosphokinase n=1 Tax=Pseudomonas sp. NPDC096950 TaxID=3364485 RepID=UPI00383A3696